MSKNVAEVAMALAEYWEEDCPSDVWNDAAKAAMLKMVEIMKTHSKQMREVIEGPWSSGVDAVEAMLEQFVKESGL